jgi:hypothetical protein
MLDDVVSALPFKLRLHTIADLMHLVLGLGMDGTKATAGPILDQCLFEAAVM